MGCDVIAPSDMMDGRVKKEALIKINLMMLVFILCYKICFKLYGPFRKAIGSKSRLKDKKLIKWI